MRLQSLVPHLPQAFVSALESCGIRTDSDLLFSGSNIDILSRLPPTTVSLADLNAYISIVEMRAAAPGICGDDLLTEELAKQDDSSDDFYRLTSGIAALDELTDGFAGSRVLEISGLKGSGKTALALQIVLRHLSSSPNAAALWIDTAGEFSPERAARLSRLYDREDANSALDRLQVSVAFDVHSAYDVLGALRSNLLENRFEHLQSRTRCVVIDHITPLLGPLLSAVSSHGHAVMTMFMRYLRTLAQTFSLTVLVINGTSGALPHNPDSAFASTVRKPALGPSFTFMTDCTIWLARWEGDESVSDGNVPTLAAEDGGVTHVAEIFRSKTFKSKTWCKFRIRHGYLMNE